MRVGGDGWTAIRDTRIPASTCANLTIPGHGEFKLHPNVCAKISKPRYITLGGKNRIELYKIDQR